MTTMAINYSLSVRLANPGKKEEGNKTYATAQYAHVMELADMAAHMSSHDSKYNKGDVMAVLTQMAACLREQLLMGNKVELGDLGAFYPVLRSGGAENAESFSTSMIRKVIVRWSPGPLFADLKNAAQFKFVGTRKAQLEARKSERERLNDMATNKPEYEGPGSGDDSGNIGD